MTQGVSGVDWKQYKHPLPEHVYDVYMQYSRDVELSYRDVRLELDLCPVYEHHV